MRNIKYIVFDVGGVLAKVVSDYWYLPPNFYNIVGDFKNKDELYKIVDKNVKYLDMRNIKNTSEEEKMFYKYYSNILNELGINKKIVLQNLINDTIYNDHKFEFYNDVKDNIERLSRTYSLAILSDGWPSTKRILDNYDISKYFKTIIISSQHGCRKKDGKLFQILKDELKIHHNQALFIDDREDLLEIANNYGFIPIRMDRKKNRKKSHYKIIKSLNELN